jgi:hypothetical protein
MKQDEREVACMNANGPLRKRGHRGEEGDPALPPAGHQEGGNPKRGGRGKVRGCAHKKAEGARVLRQMRAEKTRRTRGRTGKAGTPKVPHGSGAAKREP